MTFSALITTKYIKDNSPMLGYVNDDELRTCIKPAQDIHIGGVLGNRLYNRITDAVLNNNLSNDDILLIETYIQPALMYWVIYEYLLLSNYRLTNKAISKQSSDNSTPSDLVEVNKVKSNIRDWCEYYNQNITDYLMDNIVIFPEYTLASGYSEKVGNRNNFLFGGMYIPRRRFGSRWYDCPDPTRWDQITLYWG
jgi:hypothetical protein